MGAVVDGMLNSFASNEGQGWLEGYPSNSMMQLPQLYILLPYTDLQHSTTVLWAPWESKTQLDLVL